MSALEIALALALDRFLRLHRDPALWNWHRRWRDWLDRRGLLASAGGWASLALVLAPPLALVMWLDLVLPAWLGSLLGLAILLHAFGARDLYGLSERYLLANGRRDAAAMQASAAELGTESDPTAVARALVRGVLHQYLSPIFWALLLGPAGALLVRATTGWLAKRDDADRPLRERMRAVQGLLDWVPVRLALVLFGVVGNFDAAWRSWQGNRPGLPLYNANLVQLETLALAAGGESGGDLAVKATRGLLMRALVLVFGVAALLTLWHW